MNRKVEIAAATGGALVGAAVSGATGALMGAGIGIVASWLGRETDGVKISKHHAKEMESATHILLAANWGIRPVLMMADDETTVAILDVMFQGLMLPVLNDITPQRGVLRSHMLRTHFSGIPPYESMRHLRKRFGPRLLRRDPGVLDAVVELVLDVYARTDNMPQLRNWFHEWGKEVGLGEKGAALWDERFGPARIAEDQAAREMDEEFAAETRR